MWDLGFPRWYFIFEADIRPQGQGLIAFDGGGQVSGAEQVRIRIMTPPGIFRAIDHVEPLRLPYKFAVRKFAPSGDDRRPG